MFRRLFLLSFLAASTLLSEPLLAAFEARLTLPDGGIAAGYTVAVVGQPVTAVTDADGRLALDPAPAVPFVLVATSPGGETSAPFEVVDLAVGELTLPEALRESVTVVSGVAPGLDLLLGSLLLFRLYLGEAGKFYRGFRSRFEAGAFGVVRLLRKSGERRWFRRRCLFRGGRRWRRSGLSRRYGCFGYSGGFCRCGSGFVRRYTNFFFNPSPRWFNCCSWSTAPTFAIFMSASSTDKRWFLLPL